MSRSFATPLVRSSATIGGNIASFAPVADAIVPLLALNATLALQASDGKTWNQPLASFITTRTQYALLTQISVPVLAKDAFWFYYKLGQRKDGAAAVASVALIITTEEQHIKEARIALGAITPVQLRATRAETVLLNEPLPLSDQVIEHCLSTLATELQEPRDDLWASAAYRIMMSQALVKKALKQLNLHAQRNHKEKRGII